MRILLNGDIKASVDEKILEAARKLREEGVVEFGNYQLSLTIKQLAGGNRELVSCNTLETRLYAMSRKGIVQYRLVGETGSEVAKGSSGPRKDRVRSKLYSLV